MTSFDSSESYRGVRALVLGASGFIGRWIARALAGYGAEVYHAVRDRDAFVPAYSVWGLSGPVFEADLERTDCLESLLREVRPAVTFNATGYGVDSSERDEGASYRINTYLVRRLAEGIAAIRDLEWPGLDVVNTGTALEYGEIQGNLREDSAPNPTTVYGRSKLAGTKALEELSAARGLKSVTARLFTVYGPGEHAGRLLPTLLEAAFDGGAARLTAGFQKRDFTYVEDVAEGICRLALAKPQPGEAVNLATGRLTAVREFVQNAQAVLQIPNERLEFGHIPVKAEETAHGEVCVLRLKELVSWIPPTGVEEGIRRTAQFMRGIK